MIVSAKISIKSSKRELAKEKPTTTNSVNIQILIIPFVQEFF